MGTLYFVGVAMLIINYQIIFSGNSFSNCSTFPRKKRYLIYPPPGEFAPTKVQLILGLGLPMEVDVSMIIGYVMKFNYVLPYNASYLTNPYVRYDRSINHDDEAHENHDTRTHSAETRAISRWELYDVLALALESTKSGKACLLKAICEAAVVPFNEDHGLTSQLIHLLLTPSTTHEPFRTEFDRDYHAVEIMGRQNGGHCDMILPECTTSILEYFTDVY